MHVKVNRIKYLHYLLSKSETEMLAMFFWTQWRSPCKGDWVHTVKNDLNDLEIPCDTGFISGFSKLAFKSYLKSKAINYTFRMLMVLKEGHSKLKHLQYDKLVTQSYLISENITVNEIRTIFLFRTRMYQFAGNYRGTHLNRLCPLCGKHPDLQEYLSECYTIKEKFDRVNDEIESVLSQNIVISKARKVIEVLDYREKVKETEL